MTLIETPPQTPFSSPEHGLTMILPAGFLREGSDPLSDQRNLACFVKIDPQPWVRLCLERVGGGIPGNARRHGFAWKEVELAGVSFSSEYPEGKPVEIVAVTIPMKTQPLWLVGMAPAGSRNHAEAAVVSTLATLQAPIETKAERSARMEKRGESFGNVAGIIMAIGVGMWLMKRRMTKQSKS